MIEDTDPAALKRRREALISLTAINYIEEHMLLDAAQMADARKSLHALFLRTSGAETMLRRLIEVLKVRRSAQNTFTSISSIIGAVRRSVESLEERAGNLRRLIERSPISAEAHAQFVGSFLSYSKRFLLTIGTFEKALHKYLAVREQEARAKINYRIVQESRERLRRRLTTSNLAQANDAVETRIKDELTTSLNYGEAETAMQVAVKQSRAADTEAQMQLEALLAMSQAADHPSKRDRGIVIKPEDDMFARFEGVLANDPTAHGIEKPVRELLALYRRVHVMFQIDVDRLKQALQRLENNTGAYFQAKEEDRDITTKREKLRKVEALIQFLERAAQIALLEEPHPYAAFSKALSETISQPYAAWSFAAAELLPAKVRAEAELCTLSGSSTAELSASFQ